MANSGNLSIPLYVVPKQAMQGKTVSELFANLQESNTTFEQGMNTLLQELKNAGIS